MRTVISITLGLLGGLAIGWSLDWVAEQIGKHRRRKPRILITVGDITKEHVDVIVNAAKSSLMGGGGVDGAIHQAGGPDILAECRLLRADTHPDGLPTGQAVETGAGRLNARYVIHTVGPVYSPTEDRSELLRACYRNSLALADQLGARTVAFPLVSSGVYGWPVDDALWQAVSTISSTRTKVRDVHLVLYDDATYRTARTIMIERGMKI